MVCVSGTTVQRYRDCNGVNMEYCDGGFIVECFQVILLTRESREINGETFRYIYYISTHIYNIWVNIFSPLKLKLVGYFKFDPQIIIIIIILFSF